MQRGYALALPAHAKSLSVSGRTVLSVSTGANHKDVLCAWPLDGLSVVDRLAQRTSEAEEEYGLEDPIAYEVGDDEGAFDGVPDGTEPASTHVMPARIGSASLRRGGDQYVLTFSGGRENDHVRAPRDDHYPSCSVLLYDVTAGRVVTRLLGHTCPAEVSSQAHCANGMVVSHSARDGLTFVWDARSGRLSLIHI